jgi:phage-related protein
MSLVWPVTLDDCRVSHRVKPSHNVLRTQMDDGTSKTRLATTKSNKRFTAVLEFTGAQLDTFEAFLEDGARTLPFEWEDPQKRAPAVVKFTKTDFDWDLVVGGDTPERSRYRGTVEFEIVGPVSS